MTLNLNSPFQIPFAQAQHPDCAALNEALRTLFLQRERAGTANPTATMQINPALFESRFDLFKWPDACVRSLRDWCWQQLMAFVREVNRHDEATLRRLVGHADAWFHIARRGGYFGLHNHPMASWSGVYCVATGQDDEGRRDSGLLSFPHPMAASAMFIDAGNNRLSIPYSYASRELRLQPGQLVLFPSWLMHQVTPFMGEGERITVAFNAWFTLDESRR